MTTSDRAPQSTQWFVFREHRLLVSLNGRSPSLPPITDPSTFDLTIEHQRKVDAHTVAVSVSDESQAPDGMKFINLRSLFGQLADAEIMRAGRASMLINWERNHQYCGRCATLTENTHELSRRCPTCGLVVYPRISPAVIMRVTKGKQILLAHNKRHPSGFYSVLAGFVEPGETLEAAVAREIKEEVGIDVKDIRYFGSQPWPFPNSLMLGFTCEYAGGVFRFEDDEIEEADWYDVDQLPLTPPSSISIAGELIEAFVADVQKNK